MAMERRRVTKIREPHPADPQVAVVAPEVAAPQTVTPEQGSKPAASTPSDSPRRSKATSAPKAASTTQAAGAPVDEGAKVPSSWRLKRSMLNRLDKAARVIPAELDQNMSKNLIVETAIDEYLKRFGL